MFFGSETRRPTTPVFIRRIPFLSKVCTPASVQYDSDPRKPPVLQLCSERHSPFRDIPNEILQIIFDYCCDVNCFKVVHPGNRLPGSCISLRTKPALALSSVNSRWRANAIFAMPHIWSRIKLEWLWKDEGEGYDREEYGHLFFPLINFFSRSSESPLTIDLVWNKEKLSVVHPMLEQLLLPNMRRLRSITFQSSLCIFNTLAAGLPELRDSIDMTLVDGSYSNRVTIIFAPRRVKKITTDPLHLRRSLPTYQLSHLEIFRPRRNDMVIFSSKVGCLESLAIDDSYHGSTVRENLHPITCPSIETLTVHHYHSHSPSCSIFACFTLPSLQKLSFQPAKNPEFCSKNWPSFPVFVDFVRRSSFRLTSLSLESLLISDLSLVTLLSLLPTLVDLFVSDTQIPYMFSPITERFIESLHAQRPSYLHPRPTPLLPHLRSLRLYTWAQTKFNDMSLVETVRSRWIPEARSTSTGMTVACLRDLTLAFRNRKKEWSDVYKPLEDLEREGLRVVLLWKN